MDVVECFMWALFDIVVTIFYDKVNTNACNIWIQCEYEIIHKNVFLCWMPFLGPTWLILSRSSLQVRPQLILE